jgi:type IV pilus biogenesis protein CpaD/CtpE
VSKLAEFRQLERHLAEQLQALESMKGDSALQAEIEFEGKLRTLLGEYSKSLRDIVSILDPGSAGRSLKTSAVSEKVTRRARTLKVYKNPHTGESIETKGGNHKLLKTWKSEHGADEVESWLK